MIPDRRLQPASLAVLTARLSRRNFGADRDFGRIDDLAGSAGCIETGLTAFFAKAVENGERWIFEGGLSRTYDHRASRATSLIWLDLALTLRLWRVGARVERMPWFFARV